MATDNERRTELIFRIFPLSSAHGAICRMTTPIFSRQLASITGPTGLREPSE